MSEQNQIVSSDFSAAIPDALKPFISVTSPSLPHIFTPILEAFGVAMACIQGKIRIRRLLNVIIGTAPFRLSLGSGILSYAPHHQTTINVHIEDLIIYLDAQKMLAYRIPIIVACILEEFAHAIMCIQDEELVSEVVVQLYNGIELVDGKYQVKETPANP